MSRIKAENTTPELLVRKFLFSMGLRFRLHAKELPGKPDIVLPKYRTIVFVNGCFWHGHKDCRDFIIPKTRQDWWMNKIMKTKERDQNNLHRLKKLGWDVHVVWECDLKNLKRTERLSTLYQKILMGSN